MHVISMSHTIKCLGAGDREPGEDSVKLHYFQQESLQIYSQCHTCQFFQVKQEISILNQVIFLLLAIYSIFNTF